MSDEQARATEKLAEAIEHLAEELHDARRDGILIIVQDRFPVNSDRPR